MNVLIVTGGSIDYKFACEYIKRYTWDYVVCADAGMKFCHAAGILPDLILGDFDSVDDASYSYFKEKCPERMEQFPTHKDETDTELALLRAIAAGADTVTMIGATGTRMDHVMGNIQMLKLAMDKGVSCQIVDAHNRIRMVQGQAELKKSDQFGKYVSLLPFTPEVIGITLKGFAYEVEDFTLVSGIARGVSNELEAETGTITCREGILLVIESRD
ncbi:thiamine diphosphokinase [uncultured Eubacterium sp.]|uniref:thiamine diphosphokinase n=1 Tax=uncultured Eubacterium sp. TaxID=165185 RepID=UPI0025FD7882|nr:thiamine diphosphokinase [uncultured Eubacterium sp.]MCI6536144.1 thiamine diphosphokinase [Lachnospiraceae bacterium]